MDFVLVHGGWHGGWCWRYVKPILEAVGHRVFTPTLTGLGERKHLVAAVKGPDTHVEDIVNLIHYQQLEKFVLVGHSYGGLITTAVASHVPQRIHHLVYLDAFVPVRSGEPTTDTSPPHRIAEIKAAMDRDGNIAPNGFERWSSNPKTIDWLKQMCTKHPGVCFEKGATWGNGLSDVKSKTYIWCSDHTPSPFEQFYNAYKDDPNWTVTSLPCLHDAMLDLPEELAALLTDCA